GALMGVGVSMIFNGGGTCAGTDVIARLIARSTHVKVNALIMIIDSTIVIFGLIAFRDLTIPLYSWLVIFIFSYTVGILFKGEQFKSVFIVTTKPEEVRQIIISEDLKIGGNYLHAQGLYSLEDKKIIFAMVRRKKINKLRKRVEAVDENVFFIVMDLTQESYYYSTRGW
ncbi:MAG: YitT family protein, partial [Prevotella sp.]|nr:YitT family protein [Prevotella sp.]